MKRIDSYYISAWGWGGWRAGDRMRLRIQVSADGEKRPRATVELAVSEQARDAAGAWGWTGSLPHGTLDLGDGLRLALSVERSAGPAPADARPQRAADDAHVCPGCGAASRPAPPAPDGPEETHCHICGRDFAIPRGLKRHVTVMHPGQTNPVRSPRVPLDGSPEQRTRVTVSAIPVETVLEVLGRHFAGETARQISATLGEGAAGLAPVWIMRAYGRIGAEPQRDGTPDPKSSALWNDEMGPIDRERLAARVLNPPARDA
jgi:hypothetical protein